MRTCLLTLWQFAVNYIGGNVLCPKRLRVMIYRLFGIKTNADRFNSKVWFYSPNINIGRDSFINNGVFFHNYSTITLGKNVFVGPEVMITTVSHEVGDSSCRATALKSQPITIKDGSWIGTRAVILPGVTIGEGCIIAAAAVVTKNCQPNGLYAGVPARRIKDLD